MCPYCSIDQDDVLTVEEYGEAELMYVAGFHNVYNSPVLCTVSGQVDTQMMMIVNKGRYGMFYY